MKHHLCVISSDQNLIAAITSAFNPLGIEVENVDPVVLLDHELEKWAKVTLIDLESFDSLPQRIGEQLRKSLNRTLCVPIAASAGQSVCHRWFGTSLKTLSKPLTGAQLRWLVFQCVGRLKAGQGYASGAPARYQDTSPKPAALVGLESVFKHQHPEKFDNQRRVVNLVKFISQRCRIDPLIGQAIASSAAVYDLGALLERPVGASTGIVNLKRSRPFHSAALAKFSGASQDVVRILRNLDENWDGTGHPKGKKGAEIPIGARMLRIAVEFIRLQYDSERGLYLSTNESAAWLRDAASKLFDPELVPKFLDYLLQNEPQGATETLWICGARNLLSGMTLSEDLYGRSGLMLLSKGKVLNEHLVSRLIDYEERFCAREGLFAGVQNQQERPFRTAN